LGATPQTSRERRSLALRSSRIFGGARPGCSPKTYSVLFTFSLGPLVETSRRVCPTDFTTENLEVERRAPAQPSSSARWRTRRLGYKLAKIFGAGQRWRGIGCGMLPDEFASRFLDETLHARRARLGLTPALA